MTFKVHINGIERDCTPEEEAEIIERNRVASLQIEEKTKENVRQKRNLLLTESDWTQLDDTPLSNAKKLEWATYRQALRDITNQAGFPWDVSWPDQPL